MSPEQRFGYLLRQWRAEHGLTQEQLAEMLGFHPQYVGDLERGERNISLRVMGEIGNRIGYQSTDDLLDALKQVGDSA